MKFFTNADVYAPREDSTLLATAATNYAKGHVLDMGCGSGIVGISCAAKATAISFADINSKAIECAKKNVLKNMVKSPCHFIQSDLFSNITKKFDTILFNPPYFPTIQQEKKDGKYNTALDGGINGRDVLDRFLKSFETHLASNGILLLLNSSRSAPDGQSGNEITREILEKKGFNVNATEKADFFFEHLVVFYALKA
jgi:release factor glutamine methyltransferase